MQRPSRRRYSRFSYQHNGKLEVIGVEIAACNKVSHYGYILRTEKLFYKTMLLGYRLNVRGACLTSVYAVYIILAAKSEVQTPMEHVFTQGQYTRISRFIFFWESADACAIPSNKHSLQEPRER